MAGSKSDYFENAVLDVLGGTDVTAPATVYIALYTAAPNDASTGSSGGTEVSGNNYSRASVTNNATNWPAASAGAKANGTAITFPAASGGNWGTVVAFAIIDASSGGNILYWGDLGTSKAINDGDTASFAIGDIDITED